MTPQAKQLLEKLTERTESPYFGLDHIELKKVLVELEDALQAEYELGYDNGVANTEENAH